MKFIYVTKMLSDKYSARISYSESAGFSNVKFVPDNTLKLIEDISRNFKIY